MNEEHKFLALLSYIHILCFIPLLSRPNDEFVQFHAKQGLVLFVVEIVSILTVFTFVVGWLMPIGLFFCGIASLMGMLNVVRGEEKEIPGIQWLVKKLNV